MSKIKLKFNSFWANANKSNSRMIYNWGPPPDKFELVEGPDFDYLISFSHTTEMLSTPREKNILVTMEPTWSSNSRQAAADQCFLVLTCDPKLKGNNIVLRHPFMFCEDSRNDAQSHHVFGPTVEEYLSFKSFPDEIDELSYPRKASYFIANHQGFSAKCPHSGTHANYELKERLLSQILESDLDVHIFGRNWNISDPRYKGAPPLKKDGLLNYKYNIAIENSCEPHYLSEKLFDGFLYHCVPIYYGCSTAQEAYPFDCFASFDPTREDVIEQLRHIISQPVSPRQKALRAAKLHYYEAHNLFTYLEEIL